MVAYSVAQAESIVRTDFDFKTNFSNQFEIWSGLRLRLVIESRTGSTAR